MNIGGKNQVRCVVQLAQVNYRYGHNAYFPYSAGLLQAYVMGDSELQTKVEFRPTIFLRKKIEQVVVSLDGVNLLALSSYIWNWNYNLNLAEAAKRMFPAIKICLGGPQVPKEGDRFLKENPNIDFVIHNEGEIAFHKLLSEMASENPDFKNVPSLSYRQGSVTLSTQLAPRVEELNSLPSPYISGIFNNLILQNPDLEFQATQETHRGCPYQCTFCDWGSATMTKVRRFGKDRLAQEYEWFGQNQIELLYNADANYGLFPEDVELTDLMISTKKKYGYPKKFRAAYAKNSNDRVFEIAAKLEKEKMCKGVTLSFQSMDSLTLDLIKRRNMKVNNFKELITMYRQAEIPTYTELIIGLPGETYSSFKLGIETLLDAGQHDSLSIYHAMLLENAEMNDKSYREFHKIQSKKIPLLLLHGSIEEDDIKEYFEVITGTATLPTEDWVATSVFAWVVQAFHCLNITQAIAVALKNQYDISYSNFYEKLIVFSFQENSLLRDLFEDMQNLAQKVAEGTGTLDFEDRSFGEIMWPVEEIVFLRTLKTDIWEHLKKFLREEFSDVEELDIEDLVNYQRISLRSPNPEDFQRIELKADWHSYISDLLQNREVQLQREPTNVTRSVTEKYPNQEEYAKHVVWYGRKGSSLRDKSLVAEPRS